MTNPDPDPDPWAMGDGQVMFKESMKKLNAIGVRGSELGSGSLVVLLVLPGYCYDYALLRLPLRLPRTSDQ